MSNFFQGVLRSILVLSVSVTGSTVFVITESRSIVWIMTLYSPVGGHLGCFQLGLL